MTSNIDMTSTDNTKVAAIKGIGTGAIVLFYFLSFMSGVAALIYEITWAKMLALTFGSTTLAAAAVIAGFMGGMGFGAKLYHFIYDRFNRPVVIYALLEFGIDFWGYMRQFPCCFFSSAPTISKKR